MLENKSCGFCFSILANWLLWLRLITPAVYGTVVNSVLVIVGAI